MFKKRIIVSLLLSLTVIMQLASCERKQVELTQDNKTNETSQSNSSEAVSTTKIEEKKETVISNFTEPKEGEEIIVMTIKDQGEIKIKLFPELLPKAVENFTGLAKDKYYDGLIFHRVIENFMIQGGDPLGTGFGGESIWGEKFDGGVSDQLFHFPGAVAYANSGSTATNGSQFYIVTGALYTEDDMKNKWNITDEVILKKYSELGGAPFLDGGYTVFGQVFEGLELVEALDDVKVNNEDRPLQDMVIEKVEVVKYKK